MSEKNLPETGLYASLWNIGVRAIRELEADRGILASGREEVYGCIFGRDSLITSLSLLSVYEKTKDVYYLGLVRKVLLNLADLQGRVVNIESGEEPGKIIHEYRPDNHEHLTAHHEKPWYVYGDNKMRNYDSADSTPLFLMTAHAYLRLSGDREFIESLRQNIVGAIDWMREYGDSNGDGFFDYRFHSERNFGGLQTQSWMDSGESVFFEDAEERPQYPIAPVEVQAYAYTAYRSWSEYFRGRDEALSADLSNRADSLKKDFNATFVIEEGRGKYSLAFAIDGAGKLLTSARSSMGHCLWAVWKGERGEMPDSIIADEYIPAIARRLLTPDLYVPRAGIRTLSMRSRCYEANSYHNGSIWPHDTMICAEGLANFGFREEAKRVRRALVAAYSHFNTPLELFVYKRGFKEYSGPTGQGACRTQAWSAASLLALVHDDVEVAV
jgi:glycogen debranching enzyme